MPNPVALFCPYLQYLGSRDPPGELPEGEDCVFRRPPVVIINTHNTQRSRPDSRQRLTQSQT
jgi:hypothetical protein